MAKATSGGAARRSYSEKRDFARTPEPRDGAAGGDGARIFVAPQGAPIFVVQKHAARRLHWDFRLEHGGVLWSWAVPKGPSMDPADKRLAVHVEDHPVDYARFEGTIPAGNYGAGSVEIWDRGHWSPLSHDPAASLRAGELKFRLDGGRLSGSFVLVRLKPKAGDKADNWLLIKEKDTASPPRTQAPQLATLVAEAPDGPGWVTEIKFDGYRMLCRKQGDAVTLLTRNGLDWTERLPALAEAVRRLPTQSLMLDGELVSLEGDGRSSFAALQEALSNNQTGRLSYYAFDLLHQDDTDLRPLPLGARKQALKTLLEAADADQPIRISEHLTSKAARVRGEACKHGLEGVVCKRLDAPYRAGRGTDWVKLKCENREEFVIVGFTAPKGSRADLGALQVGRYDAGRVLHFAGGVGTGLSVSTLRALRGRLDGLVCKSRPRGLQGAAAAPRGTVWVKPKLVAEVRFAGITTDGMLRQASFLGLREDKPAGEVVAARPPKPSAAGTIHGQRLTHPDRLLWPDPGGITKAELAEYWQAVAARALPGIETRPLALVRCPDGIEGQHFFQKHRTRGMPEAIAEDAFEGAPYLTVSGLDGLIAASQIAAIELHCWGSGLDDAGHADQLVFDLDPGDGVRFGDVVAAAKEVRRRLREHGLAAYARTSGGKGLHVVSPIRTSADWDAVRAWCRGFAERMEQEAPDSYVASTRKSRRVGRILVDWLRNGLGSTAIASYAPRARPGGLVATPLAWREVNAALDPGGFTIRTLPGRLRGADPWARFDADRRDLDI